MSVVHAVATVVATPTPTPNPQIIKEFITTQLQPIIKAQTPAVTVQAVQLALVFFGSLALSVIHRVVEWFTAREKGWSKEVNTLTATGYSLAVAFLGVSGAHQLAVDVAGAVALLMNFGVAVAGSFWTYAWRKVFAKWTGVTQAPALPDIPLATEDTSAAG